jgi:hypothetical protein
LIIDPCPDKYAGNSRANSGQPESSARPGRDRGSDKYANSETEVSITTKIISNKSVVHLEPGKITVIVGGRG